MDSHHGWVRLLCLCLPLWKSTTLLLTSASVCWDRRRGVGTSDSPRGCGGSFALDLKSGLGSSFSPLLTDELEVRIDHRAGEILCHQVSRSLGALHLSRFELVEILLLLDPQRGDINMTEFVGTFAIGYR